MICIWVGNKESADADAADRQAVVDHIGMVHALSLRQEVSGNEMIAIPIPIQTPHAPDGPVFDFLFFQVHLFFFHLATSRGNPGGFWNDPGRDFLRTAPNS